jgi:hypothetical protein
MVTNRHRHTKEAKYTLARVRALKKSHGCVEALRSKRLMEWGVGGGAYMITSPTITDGMVAAKSSTILV